VSSAAAAATGDRARAQVLRNAVAIALASGAYGLSFGAVGVTAGLSTLQTCVLSLVAFTGASQFALVGVLGAGGSAAAGIASALLLGCRNTLYGVRLSSLLAVRGARRPLAAHVTIDETTAMTTAAPPELRSLAFRTSAVWLFCCWNLATLLGALGAGVVDTSKLGLDAAVGGAFLALLAPQIRTLAAGRVALAGALLAAATIPFTPAGVPVLVAGLAVLPGVLRR
jgi:predicted branched-subunit amino acid permease